MDKEKIIIDVDLDSGMVECNLKNNGVGCSFDGIYRAAVTLLCCIKNDVDDIEELMDYIKEELMNHEDSAEERLLC